MLAQIFWSLWSLGQAVRTIGRRRLWIPFGLLLALQILVILSLTHFYAWPLSIGLAPILEFFLGEKALHYPYNFLALPLVWSRVAIAIDLVLSGLVMGCTYLLLLRSRGERGPDVPGVLRSWWAFALARLPIQAGLVLLLILLPAWLVGDGDGLRGNLLRLFRAGTLAASVGLEALYLFVPLLLLKQRLADALREGMGLALRYPVAAYLLVGIPALVHVPLVWIMGRSQLIVDRMAPEAVGWLVALNVVLAALTSYVAVVGAGEFHGAMRKGAP